MEKEIRITIKVPRECTDEQLLEWLQFELHYTACMPVSNPLSDFELEATSVTIY